MKRSIVLTLVILAFSHLPLSAQGTPEIPKVEAFFGYSLYSVDVDQDGSTNTFKGWQANIGVNPWERWGITGDFGTQNHRLPGTLITLNTYEYAMGPRYNWRTNRTTVFGQALLGGFHLVREGGAGINVFGAMFSLGGGVDIKINSLLAVRVVQLDWVKAHANGWNNGIWNNSVRTSFGIVIKDKKD